MENIVKKIHCQNFSNDKFGKQKNKCNNSVKKVKK